MPKLQEDAIQEALKAAMAYKESKGILHAEENPLEHLEGQLCSAIETLVHSGFLLVAPPSKPCPECRGSKMTEGTIGWFSCLGCGGRGRVPV